jgi:hypothetical protein
MLCLFLSFPALVKSFVSSALRGRFLRMVLGNSGMHVPDVVSWLALVSAKPRGIAQGLADPL